MNIQELGAIGELMGSSITANATVHYAGVPAEEYR